MKMRASDVAARPVELVLAGDFCSAITRAAVRLHGLPQGGAAFYWAGPDKPWADVGAAQGDAGE